MITRKGEGGQAEIKCYVLGAGFVIEFHVNSSQGLRDVTCENLSLSSSPATRKEVKKA